MTPTVRASAGAMLLAENRANKRITRAVGDATDHAVAQVARRGDRERVAAVLILLVAASKMLTGRLAEALVASRQDARAIAAKRLRVELASAGVTLELAAARTGMQADHAYAESAAQSLSAAWAGIALARASKAAREEASMAKALDYAALQMRPRIERTAATEVAGAYNAEHSAALREAALANPGLFEDVAREWRADLDKRTCERCENMDGDVVGADEDFSEGDPPMHANCRCFITIVRRQAARSAA